MNWRTSVLRTWASVAVLAAAVCAGCRTQPPLPVVDAVDIERFMGDWYVIACIPTWIERNAHSAVESYRLGPDGRVMTTFRFRSGGFDGPLHVYHSVGLVDAASRGAIWGMRFVWPFRADYRVIYVDPGYQSTVVGRTKRDYAWIMARSPTIADDELARLTGLLAGAGYDVSKLRQVPQQPTH